MIPGKQELIIGSSLDNLNEVVRLVEDVGDYYNVNNTYFGNILVAVTEAVRNAILHGNKSDKNKEVHLLFEHGSKGLEFTVSDQGEGFSLSGIPDPTELDEHDPEVKKGLYLMRSLSDILLFTNNGSTVKMSFHISSINYQLSMNRRKLLHEFFRPVDTKVRKEEE